MKNSESTNVMNLDQFLNQNLEVARAFSFAVMPQRGTKLAAGIDIYIPICNKQVKDYHEADDLMMKFLNQATNCVNQEKIIKIWNDTLSKNKDTIHEWQRIINTFILLTCINEEMQLNDLINKKLDIQMDGYLTIEPLYDVMIPSGIKVDMLPNTMFTAFNKSGIAGKRKLIVGSCVVDIDYRGQIHINLHNIGHMPRQIKCGDKISQFVIVPIVIGDVIEQDINKYDKIQTERGEGAFGSTDKK